MDIRNLSRQSVGSIDRGFKLLRLPGRKVSIKIQTKIFKQATKDEIAKLKQESLYWLNRCWKEFRSTEYYQTLKYREARDFYKVFKKAFKFAAEHHIKNCKPQERDCGNIYIDHPARQCFSAMKEIDLMLSVFPSFRVEEHVVSIILHDVIEDGDNITKEIVEQEFGEAVAFNVDAVTKSSVNPNPEEKVFENLNKLLTAASENIWSLFVKLYDVRDNIRTIRYVKDKKCGRKLKILLDVLRFYLPVTEIIGALGFRNAREIKKILFEEYENILAVSSEADCSSEREKKKLVRLKKIFRHKLDLVKEVYIIDRATSLESESQRIEFLHRIINQAAKKKNLMEIEKFLVAEVEKLDTQDPQDEWSPFVEEEKELSKRFFKRFKLKN